MSDNQEKMNEVSSDEALAPGTIAESETGAAFDPAATAASEADEATVSADGEEAVVGIRDKRHPLGWLFDFVEVLVFALCAVLLIFAFGWRTCVVDGNSMNHTLKNGERLVVTSLAKPQAGDIIVFHNTTSPYVEPLIKRVIATEGQTVRIDYANQTVEVDGVVLDEPYINLQPTGMMFPYGSRYEQTDADGRTVFEAVVPAGHYFVMGDNRNHSADSRDAAVGFVDERRVLGTLAFRISPFATADELG